MPLGVTITESAVAPSSGVPTGSATLFVAGVTTSGPTTAAVKITSITDFVSNFGIRVVATPVLYDALDAFFREGGSEAYVARLVVAPTLQNITDALALFSKELGGGQVAIPGNTTANAYTSLLAHAEANNRHALLDAPDTGVVVDLATASDDAGVANRQYGSMFAPWMRVPGVTAGTTRLVPPSAVAAALMAQADKAGNPNIAPAGRDYPLNYVLSFEDTFTDADRVTLLDDSAINTFRTVYGVRCLYGYQTLAAQDDEPIYWQTNRARTKMSIKARLNAVGESFMFRELDGAGITINAFAGALATSLQELYDVGALFGATASEAYSVNVGPGVNSPASLSDGELHAVVSVRISPHAREVIEELVSVPITQAL